VRANDALAAINDLPAETHIGRTLRDLLPDVASEVELLLRQVLETGQPVVDLELSDETSAKPGERRHWRSSFYPIQSQDGRTPGIGALVVDITERKRAEEALQESEARYRAIFEGAAIAIALVDMDGRIVHANPALGVMLGYSDQDLRGVQFTQITHPDDTAVDLGYYLELVAGKRAHYQMEKRYIRKDGHAVWGRLTVSLVHNADGNPRFAMGMVEDITERKPAEQALRESEERFQAAYATVGQATIAPDGKFLTVNRAFCDITSYAEAELLDRDFQSITYPHDLPRGVGYIE
jgi:PAS domain S-box-containing protein